MKFETMWNKARKGFDSKKDSDHVKIYTKFRSMAEKQFFGEKPQSVNVWHIEQNAFYKDRLQKQTLKSICENEFYAMQARMENKKNEK